jgi:hypothetical protein
MALYRKRRNYDDNDEGDNAGGYSITFFFTFFLSPISVSFA